MRIELGPVTMSLAAIDRYRLYHTYADALRDSEGYEHDALLDVVKAKTDAYKRMASSLSPPAAEPDVHRLLAVRSAAVLAPASLTVLDFGGACGASYYGMRRMTGSRPELKWAIVETPGMATRANDVASDSPSLRAFSAISDAASWLAPRVHLVIASGSVQYTGNPYSTLDELLGLRAPVLLLTRGVVTKGPKEIIVLQRSMLSHHGPGPLPPEFRDAPITHPVIIAPRDRLFEQLTASYRQVLCLPDHSHFRVNREPIESFAALCSEPLP